VIGELACLATRLLGYLVLARLVLSWFPNARSGPFAAVVELVERSTEWLLGPARRLIRPIRLGSGLLDVSSLVVLVGLQLVITPLVCSLAT